jgi:hypothetical protein
MKTFHALSITVVLFGLAVGCKTSSHEVVSEPSGAATASPVTSTTTPQKAEFLFVQNAKDVSFQNGTMTLHNVNPVTVCFADRPERIAGHMKTAKMIPMWSEGKNSFTADPPNATLSVVDGNNVSDLVVVLRNPRLSGADLTYDVRVLEGTVPSRGQDCSLFIDIIGMPLTPYSYAGAARRAYRRGYMYPGVYGPSFVPVAPVAVAVRPVVVY